MKIFLTRRTFTPLALLPLALPAGPRPPAAKFYLLPGAPEPMADKLAASAGKTITVRGKAAGRDGINLIENAEIVSN